MHVLVDGANVGRFRTFKGNGKGPSIEPGLILQAMQGLRAQLKDVGEVTLFLSEPTIDYWDRRGVPELKQILAADPKCITKVPSRVDVDEFILQEAKRLSSFGAKVIIVSNDNFDEYMFPRGKRAIDGLSKERVAQWLCKFTFSRDRFVIQALDQARREPENVEDVEMRDSSPFTSSDRRKLWEDGFGAWTQKDVEPKAVPVPMAVTHCPAASSTIMPSSKPMRKLDMAARNTKLMSKIQNTPPMAGKSAPVPIAARTTPRHNSSTSSTTGLPGKHASNASETPVYAAAGVCCPPSSSHASASHSLPMHPKQVPIHIRKGNTPNHHQVPGCAPQAGAHPHPIPSHLGRTSKALSPSGRRRSGGASTHNLRRSASTGDGRSNNSMTDVSTNGEDKWKNAEDAWLTPLSKSRGPSQRHEGRSEGGPPIPPSPDNDNGSRGMQRKRKPNTQDVMMIDTNSSLTRGPPNASCKIMGADFVKPPSWDAIDELIGRAPKKKPRK